STRRLRRRRGLPLGAAHDAPPSFRAARARSTVVRFTIDLGESLRIAIQALRGNKVRGALTTLGIIIGIVAVVTTVTAADGLQNKFRESFPAVGADVIYVSRMPWIVMNDFFMFRNRPPIDLREARALEDKLRGRAVVNPSINGQQDLKYRDQ